METSNTKSNLKENISLIDSELLEIRKRIYLLENGMNGSVPTEHNVTRKSEQNEYSGYSPSFYETYSCQTEPSPVIINRQPFTTPPICACHCSCKCKCNYAMCKSSSSYAHNTQQHQQQQIPTMDIVNRNYTANPTTSAITAGNYFNSAPQYNEHSSYYSSHYNKTSYSNNNVAMPSTSSNRNDTRKLYYSKYSFEILCTKPYVNEPELSRLLSSAQAELKQKEETISNLLNNILYLESELKELRNKNNLLESKLQTSAHTNSDVLIEKDKMISILKSKNTRLEEENKNLKVDNVTLYKLCNEKDSIINNNNDVNESGPLNQQQLMTSNDKVFLNGTYPPYDDEQAMMNNNSRKKQLPHLREQLLVVEPYKTGANMEEGNIGVGVVSGNMNVNTQAQHCEGYIAEEEGNSCSERESVRNKVNEEYNLESYRYGMKRGSEHRENNEEEEEGRHVKEELNRSDGGNVGGENEIEELNKQIDYLTNEINEHQIEIQKSKEEISRLENERKTLKSNTNTIEIDDNNNNSHNRTNQQHTQLSKEHQSDVIITSNSNNNTNMLLAPSQNEMLHLESQNKHVNDSMPFNTSTNTNMNVNMNKDFINSLRSKQASQKSTWLSKLPYKTPAHLDIDQFSPPEEQDLVPTHPKSDPHLIFTIYDHKRVLCFDPINKKFNVIGFADYSNFDETYIPDGSLMLSLPDTLYIITGESFDTLFKFVLSKRSMTKLSHLNNNHCNGGLVYIETTQTLYCLSGAYNKAVESYSLTKNHWNTLAEGMNAERSSASYYVFNNEIVFAFFGYNNPQNKYLNNVEYCNIAGADSNCVWNTIEWVNNPDGVSLELKNHFVFGIGESQENEEGLILIGGFDGLNGESVKNYIEVVLSVVECEGGDGEEEDNGESRYEFVVTVRGINKEIVDIAKNKKYVFDKGCKYYEEDTMMKDVCVFDDKFNVHVINRDELGHDIYYFEK